MKKTNHLVSGTIAILLIGLVTMFVLRQPDILGRFLDMDIPGLLLFLGITVVVFLFAFISYFEYHGIGPQDGIIRRGPHENIVSITFDDGPNPSYTPQILDVLKEKGVKATFFVVGLHVKKYPEIARRIVAEGHDIGNHTYTHKDLVPSTRRMVLAQVHKTNQIIKRATGVATNLFRPPRGIYSNAVRKLLVDEEGYRFILWSVSSTDWRKISPSNILKRIQRHTKPGAILLFHDSGALVRREGGSRENTVESLGMIIDYLQNKGYEIVPVSEMIKRIENEEIEAAGVLEQV